MRLSRPESAVMEALQTRPAFEIKFGGWHNGDNHKPGRGWYFICRCGNVGLGQLLSRAALCQWEKHAQRCNAILEEERTP